MTEKNNSGKNIINASMIYVTQILEAVQHVHFITTLIEVCYMKNKQHTCQAKWLKAKLCAIQDDKAVSLVQPWCRVLHIALKVPGLLSKTDLLDLSNVNWDTDTQNTLSKTAPYFTTEIKITHLNHFHVTISWNNSQATWNHEAEAVTSVMNGPLQAHVRCCYTGISNKENVQVTNSTLS